MTDLFEAAKALQAEGKLGEAIVAYESALVGEPDNFKVLNNLGTALEALGQSPEAATYYRRAIELAPGESWLHYNLGHALQVQGLLEPAAAAYERALVLEADMLEAHFNLGNALIDLERFTDAERAVRRWMEYYPDDVLAAHLLTSVTGEGVKPRMDDACVRAMFDGFSADFESRLGQLEYCGPSLIADLIECRYATPLASLDVLDAGCGTGLCAEALRPIARRLIGVDLSPGMLAKADARGVYDELHEDELVRFLQARRASFDLIVIADTFPYFGVLDVALQACFESLRPGGVLIFTAEHLEDPAPGETYRLRPDGRYRHSETYVADCVTAQGLSIVESQQVILRKERGEPVPATIIHAEKPATSA